MVPRIRAWLAAAPLLVALAGASSSGSCTSAWNESGPPPYTAVETNKALAPVQALKSRCYDASPSARERKPAKLEFLVYVDGHGGVHSEPQAADPHDPELIDCMRRGLDQLSFPAKGDSDELRLSFEMRP